jgi:hypothetical protein
MSTGQTVFYERRAVSQKFTLAEFKARLKQAQRPVGKTYR